MISAASSCPRKDVSNHLERYLRPSRLNKATASPELPDPSSGLKLAHVTLGRGTQNYTCNATSTDKPVAVGAVATLFDASCFATADASTFNALPPQALNFEITSEVSAAAVVGGLYNQSLIIGHHFFTNPTSPVFDLRASGGSGLLLGNKAADVPAPSTAVKGVANQGFGAVDWLGLDALAGSVVLKKVFRVVTAGGNPPPTCQGQTASFEVDYAAQYWFYS